MRTTPASTNELAHLRVVGIMYVATTLVGVLNTFVIKTGTYDVNSFLDTALQFRIAQAFDLVMYAGVVILGWASYMATQRVSPSLSLLALLFRYGEALLGFVALIIMLMVAIILQSSADTTAFESSQLKALATLFMNLSNAAWDILFVLMGIGAALFIYLFRVYRAIPLWLMGWGMFTYISMILFGLIRLVDPELGIKFMAVMYPGALFELTVGLWLMVKSPSTKSTVSAAV